MARTFRPGAPGVYELPPAPSRGLADIRMDVAAFVGVAPRGPSRGPVIDEKHPGGVPTVEPSRPRRLAVPIEVESFDEYRHHFGSFEGEGRLPYAVASFFANGGRRAWIVRVVHDYPTPAEDAAGDAVLSLVGFEDVEDPPAVPPPPGSDPPDLRAKVRAANEGSWGDGLSARMDYRTESLVPLELGPIALTLPRDAWLPVGSLLRLGDDFGTRVLRFVSDSRLVPDPATSEQRLVATFEAPVPFAPTAAEVVDVTLTVEDSDGRREVHTALGLSSMHPRWMATVLCAESELLRPEATWAFEELRPRSVDLTATDEALELHRAGADRWADIVPEDFFDEDWVLGNPAPRKGVHAVTAVDEVAVLVVPDLYWPERLPDLDPVEPLVPPRSGEFSECVEDTEPEPDPAPFAGVPGLLLDPSLPADLDHITGLQRRLLELASLIRRFVVLLDVPPGLDHRRILTWRRELRSAYGAAYHPWLKVAPADDGRDALILLPPSAVAAGIVATTEHERGLPHGPANALARGVVDLESHVSARHHDELHQSGINVYLREPRGIRLTAARTLSTDPAWRQLSVRRLMTMLALSIERHSQWLVFEPNGRALQSEVRSTLRAFLRQMYLKNAFRGGTEGDAFFVRCDGVLNDQSTIDAGRLIAEVGVAPAEPLEFLVLRIERDGDGTVRVEGSA